ncbi:MAG: hypothetical protein EP301_11245 [Gammaproteobacteria bacterium]|nr:MAG: hypothetical protein EP301_11245 [Gammaproteobacteria bacterium]
MKFLLRTLIGLAVSALVVVLIGYFLQDANRFKPEIQAFIEERTGVYVDITGDLSWRFFPPLGISAAGVLAEHEGSRYELSELVLDVSFMSVVRSRDINQWEILALTLDDLLVAQGEERTEIDFFRLHNFKPATPSPFTASLTQTPADGDPLPLTLDGLIAIDPSARTATLTDTRFETTQASGVCNLDAAYRDGAQPPDPEGAIIPVSIWRTVDWSGSCLLDRLTVEEENFSEVTLTLSNSSGVSSTEARIPDFFEGSAGMIVDIDASSDPVRWRLVPDLARADSTALMEFLDRRMRWIAPLAYSGEITMTGNTKEELVRSVRGQTTFDGGKGRIDIAQIKRPLLALATLLRSPEQIAAWPELWTYERLIGDWTINGTNHQLNLALDNLTAAIDGDYDPLSDALDMDVEFVFEDDPNMHSFDVNEVLVGLPIPLTCQGTLEAPQCKVTEEATRNFVAAVLTSEQGSKAREKIDQVIDEEVPEEYRETARGLLDILGESLKKRKDP